MPAAPQLCGELWKDLQPWLALAVKGHGTAQCDAIAIHWFIMKTATIPSVRVEPEFRAEVEAVLTEGETLSEFVEASVRASVERRRFQTEFIARGLRSRDEARRTGDYVDAEVAIQGLRRKLDAARERTAKQRK
jgi:hypothetical protein